MGVREPQVACVCLQGMDGLDVVMGVTRLPPSKRFSTGGDSQGMVMNHI